MFRFFQRAGTPPQERGNQVIQPAERRQNSRWLLRAIKAVLLITIFAVPLLALPFTQDALLAKVALIELSL